LNPPVQTLWLFHEVEKSLFPIITKLKKKRKGTKGMKRCRKLFVPRNLKKSIKNRELVKKTQT